MSIVQVSKAAGVSIATVSRVINKNPQVSPASVEAVHKAMERIGYTPPPPSQRYRGRPRKDAGHSGVQHGNVALLFPDHRDQAMRTALSGRLMHGVNEALMPKHLNMLATVLQADGEVPLCINRKQIDGVVVRGSVDISFLVPKLKALPCVWLLELPEVPQYGDQALEDNAAVAQTALRYLLNQGHRHVAVLNHDPLHPCYQPRTASFVAAARRSGAQVEVLEGRPSEELAREFLAMHPRPTGIFLPAPDDHLVAIYRVLAAAGVQPGKDVGWIGCSYDPPRLAALDPDLANVDIRPEEIGRAGVELLLWRLRHPRDPQRRLMIAPRLVDHAAMPITVTMA
jgi:LacI family transcriptional regulator